MALRMPAVLSQPHKIDPSDFGTLVNPNNPSPPPEVDSTTTNETTALPLPLHKTPSPPSSKDTATAPETITYPIPHIPYTLALTIHAPHSHHQPLKTSAVLASLSDFHHTVTAKANAASTTNNTCLTAPLSNNRPLRTVAVGVEPTAGEGGVEWGVLAKVLGEEGLIGWVRLREAEGKDVGGRLGFAVLVVGEGGREERVVVRGVVRKGGIF